MSSHQNTLPLPDRAVHPDRAPHQLDQPLGDHQADARALVAAGLLAQPIERLEQLRQFFRGQAGAGVLDTDANTPGAARYRSPPPPSRPSRLYLMALESRLMKICFRRVRSALTKLGTIETREGHLYAALLRLRLDHRLAFEQ